MGSMIMIMMMPTSCLVFLVLVVTFLPMLPCIKLEQQRPSNTSPIQNGQEWRQQHHHWRRLRLRLLLLLLCRMPLQLRGLRMLEMNGKGRKIAGTEVVLLIVGTARRRR
jgi:hypothetical protein